MAAARSESTQTYRLHCFAFEMRELFLKLRGIMELLLSSFAAIQLVMLSVGCELCVSAVATFVSNFSS